MHLNSTIAACALLSGVASAGLLVDRQSQNAGYLAAVFTGEKEQVFFSLADKNNPQSFRALNGGQPSLLATKGTRGARDPSITQSQDGSKVCMPP